MVTFFRDNSNRFDKNYDWIPQMNWSTYHLWHGGPEHPPPAPILPLTSNTNYTIVINETKMGDVIRNDGLIGSLFGIE